MAVLIVHIDGLFALESESATVSHSNDKRRLGYDRVYNWVRKASEYKMV